MFLAGWIDPEEQNPGNSFPGNKTARREVAADLYQRCCYYEIQARNQQRMSKMPRKLRKRRNGWRSRTERKQSKSEKAERRLHMEVMAGEECER